MESTTHGHDAPSALVPLKKLRVLVIQLARLGDTLQSLMALRAAKQLYPQLEIHFIARERFAAAAKRVPWIDSVIPLPTDSLLAPILLGQKKEIQGLPDLARWIAPLVSVPWDYVVNWSYSEASSYLTGLMPGRVKLGYSRRKDLSFVAADGWSQYFQAIIQSDIVQNIHLTDLLTTQLLTALQIHVGDPVGDGDVAATSKTFFDLKIKQDHPILNAIDSGRKWIGIQVGTGADNKNWPVESFADLIRILSDRAPEVGFVLLGTDADRTRATAIRKLLEPYPNVSQGGRLVDAVGELSFDEWATIVARSSWVISGDTSVVHLASVLGTRVIQLSVGPVRFFETGPYGNGHYVIAPKSYCLACTRKDPQMGHSCHTDVTPEVVAGVYLYAAQEWLHRRKHSVGDHLKRLGLDSGIARSKIFRARIRATSDGGGVVYEPLHQGGLSASEWFAQVLGYNARAWYCGWVPSVGQEIQRDQIGPSLVRMLREVAESSQVMKKILVEARSTAKLIAQKSRSLKSSTLMSLADRQELQRLGGRLGELDALLERVGQSQEQMRAFVQMHKVLMHSLPGKSMAELGSASAEAYQQLLDGVAFTEEWANHSLQLAKPVALRTEEFIP